MLMILTIILMIISMYQKFAKLQYLSDYIVAFAFNSCNYYEGGSKCPLYESITNI
jgi:hypothetical protein